MNRSQCTICQDLLLLEDTVACPCGHTFHLACITEWNQVNNSCPQCRKNFGKAKPIKLFFDIPDKGDEEEDPAELKNKLNDFAVELSQKDTEIKQQKDKMKAAKKELKNTRMELEAVRAAVEKSENVNNVLKRQLTFLERHKEEAVKARITAQKLQKNLDDLQTVEELIKGEKHEVESMLKKFGNNSDSMHQIIASFVIMKKEFEKLKESKSRLNDDKKTQRREIEELRRKLQISNNEQKAMHDQLKLAETDLKYTDLERQKLQKKLQELEQAFVSPSPRASAIKRLLRESPAPMAFKKARHSTSEEVENFHEDDQHMQTSSPFIQPCFEDLENENLKEIASEIGLKIIGTTNITAHSSKAPLAESKKIFNMKSATSSQFSSSCSVIQKGYNGLGGQSKFIKPSTTKKLSSRVKVPKSSKVSKPINHHFMPNRNHALPNFKFSPE